MGAASSMLSDGKHLHTASFLNLFCAGSATLPANCLHVPMSYHFVTQSIFHDEVGLCSVTTSFCFSLKTFDNICFNMLKCCRRKAKSRHFVTATHWRMSGQHPQQFIIFDLLTIAFGTRHHFFATTLKSSSKHLKTWRMSRCMHTWSMGEMTIVFFPERTLHSLNTKRVWQTNKMI